MTVSVIDVLRRFLPAFLRKKPALGEAVRRAIWAITHCRTAAMGGHLHACKCGAREFTYHSCNHRGCPQCGKAATAEWVERELGKRVGAPYFMVTFTLPEELRCLFFTVMAKEIYHIYFTAAAAALSETLAVPRWLGAVQRGFTIILHTWNQRLNFHPHLHCIVPVFSAMCCRAACGRSVIMVTVIQRPSSSANGSPCTPDDRCSSAPSNSRRQSPPQRRGNVPAVARRCCAS